MSFGDVLAGRGAPRTPESGVWYVPWLLTDRWRDGRSCHLLGVVMVLQPADLYICVFFVFGILHSTCGVGLVCVRFFFG